MSHRRFAYASVDSTNERALASIASGEALHFDVHVAATQTSGRGRQGRPWVSSPGDGLYLSVTLLPEGLIAAPKLTIAAGLAVFDVVTELGLSRAELDWPNDLVVQGAKMAGILVETRGLNSERPHYVIGAGINVAQRSFPRELREERRVTSLALEGIDARPEALEEALVPTLRARLDQAQTDPAGLAGAYLRAARLEGREVRVAVRTEVVTGTLGELDFDRGLILTTSSGEQEISLELARAVERA